VPTAYLGLGSNLGDREGNLARALSLLSEKLELKQVSSVYETEPVGYEEQPLFLNLACRISTRLIPRQLMRLIIGIETDMGRVRSFRNAPRSIDIDILFYDDAVVKTRHLTIPHPRLAQRAFVLTPMGEIAPDLIHPEMNQSIAELSAVLGKSQGVTKRQGGLDVPAIRGRAL
jgi:2-amino-4-hydroxy-6-hydroxymethyldihydropteridine diphosphokinase